MITGAKLQDLQKQIKGELKSDKLHQIIYSTDASVYRKLPLGVLYPKNYKDIVETILFAQKNKIGLIPRTAGTSLAGQCVGDGLVVDVSKHLTNIISLNQEQQTVTVQPGVIRDELNSYLKPFGLFFGPNTSTSNRCMLGGMVANNSSGTTSIQYGVTRDKVLKIDAILSDGTEVTFEEIDSNTFLKKCALNSLEGSIYSFFRDTLSIKEIQDEIIAEFPKPSIHRRNTGYAIDELLSFKLFGGTKPTINIAKLLSGSEGTLAFFKEITLQLDKIPPKESILVTSHFNSLDESLKAVGIAMNHNLHTCELMDKVILDCTKGNREQEKNRFFLQGDPQAILMLEVKANTLKEAEEKADLLIQDLNKNNFGYAHPKIYGENINKVVELRKAGLGLLANIIGDKKAVACIEDTAVELKDLPNFIEDFTKIMESHNQKSVYYAHAGAGEIHLRPILNLKKKEDVELFRQITTETAHLVKKYKGSFSGEHGDGIVRAEFIPFLIGDKNYNLLLNLKDCFDAQNILNPGKIVRTYKMDENLRYIPERKEPKIKTLQDFSESEGILRLAEKCNGSGDCRKTANAGGTLCPSYRASKNEKDTTRARANTLREILTNSEQVNPFNHPELKEVFDLCLSCKACSSECPSGVDISAIKAEFLYQYQESNGYSLRNKLFAYNSKINRFASKLPAIQNFISNLSSTKKMMGIAPQRNLPALSNKTFESYLKKIKQPKNTKEIYLFVDEFTNFYDAQIGKDSVELLNKLGYFVQTVKHPESGRSFISKGFLKQAKEIANKNIGIFKDIITEDKPLIGIEPSAILSFRDEYLRLADDKESALYLSKNTFTIEEFISQEFKKGNIKKEQFTTRKQLIKIHGHCHQKALSSTNYTYQILNIPENFKVSVLATGCCGMAGSFGYEKEHYETSIKVGEDTLFPAVRNCSSDTEISASGTSCRHQIKDGTGKESFHPISILNKHIL